MEAPPYSPTATASEQGRLPYDYLPPVQHGDDPLGSLSRSRTTICTDVQDDERQQNMLRPVISAPPKFLEPPPDYAPVDALAYSFRLEAPFVHTAKTSNLPRYQLMQEFTRSGKPKKLHIRRLMASESRSHSLPSSSLEAPRIRYDDDGTMYSITCYEMRGHRSSTLAGGIQIESGKMLLGGKWAKIWHLTKNSRRDSLNPDNEAKMQKYGYKPRDEWDKRLLFHVKKGAWEDANGKQLAMEEEDGDDGRRFEVIDAVSGPRKDLMISCWIMRLWMVEGLRWENDVKGW